MAAPLQTKLPGVSGRPAERIDDMHLTMSGARILAGEHRQNLDRGPALPRQLQPVYSVIGIHQGLRRDRSHPGDHKGHTGADREKTGRRRHAKRAGFLVTCDNRPGHARLSGVMTAAARRYAVRCAIVSPSRTKVSTPSLVCSRRSLLGRHWPGSPNSTTADPPNRKLAFSSPRLNGFLMSCCCTTRPTVSAPISTKPSLPKCLVSRSWMLRSLRNRMSGCACSAFLFTVHNFFPRRSVSSVMPSST